MTFLLICFPTIPVLTVCQTFDSSRLVHLEGSTFSDVIWDLYIAKFTCTLEYVSHGFWIIQWTFRLLVSRYDSADINEIRAPRGDIIVAIHVKRNVFRHSPGNQSREIFFRFTSRQRIGSQIYYPQNILIKLIVEYKRKFLNNWSNDGLARNTKRRSPNNNFNNSIDSCYLIWRSNGMRI